MKLDTDCIKHNALRLIKENIDGWIWEADLGIEAKAPNALMTLAKIEGICALADELQEVLKA